MTCHDKNPNPLSECTLMPDQTMTWTDSTEMPDKTVTTAYRLVCRKLPYDKNPRTCTGAITEICFAKPYSHLSDPQHTSCSTMDFLAKKLELVPKEEIAKSVHVKPSLLDRIHRLLHPEEDNAYRTEKFLHDLKEGGARTDIEDALRILSRYGIIRPLRIYKNEKHEYTITVQPRLNEQTNGLAFLRMETQNATPIEPMARVLKESMRAKSEAVITDEVFQYQEYLRHHACQYELYSYDMPEDGSALPKYLDEWKKIAQYDPIYGYNLAQNGMLHYGPDTGFRRAYAAWQVQHGGIMPEFSDKKKLVSIPNPDESGRTIPLTDGMAIGWKTGRTEKRLICNKRLHPMNPRPHQNNDCVIYFHTESARNLSDQMGYRTSSPGRFWADLADDILSREELGRAWAEYSGDAMFWVNISKSRRLNRADDFIYYVLNGNMKDNKKPIHDAIMLLSYYIEWQPLRLTGIPEAPIACMEKEQWHNCDGFIVTRCWKCGSIPDRRRSMEDIISELREYNAYLAGEVYEYMLYTHDLAKDPAMDYFISDWKHAPLGCVCYGRDLHANNIAARSKQPDIPPKDCSYYMIQDERIAREACVTIQPAEPKPETNTEEQEDNMPCMGIPSY